MRFSVHLPTCTEGLVHPVPFAAPADFVRLDQAAEQLGYDGVWGNDHITAAPYVRQHWSFIEQRLPPFQRRRLVSATIGLATAEARREVEEFFRAHPVEGAERTLQQALEQLDLLVAFRARAAPRLHQWLAARK